MARRARGSKPSPSKATFRERFAYPEGGHPVRAYLVGLGDDSERVTRAALEQIADILSGGTVGAMDLAWHELRHGHVNTLRGRLQQDYAPATANRYLSALRAVLRECWRLRLVDRETLERTIDVRAVKGRRELRGRAVPQRDLEQLFRSCLDDENAAMGARDAALLALLYGVGLRRAEAASLRLSDYKAGDASLRVRGKGNKQRIAYIPEGALAALEAWLERRGRAAGERPDDSPLFCSVTRSGRVTYRDITPQLVYHVVRKRHAGLDIAEFTPHDLRRTHISDLLDEGVDLAVIARQVGHANVQTTARYDRRDQRAQKSAARRLRVPFGGRRA